MNHITDYHNIWAVPDDVTEEEFIQYCTDKWKNKGMNVTYELVPITETELYDEAKLIIEDRKILNANVKFRFYVDDELYRFKKYIDDRYDGLYKLRIFKTKEL